MSLLGGLALSCAVVLVAVGAWLGRHVPVAEQWPMFEALRTTAAIIFAVIGAWMAIIYPERLRLSFRPPASGNEADESPTGWGQLFSPVVHSTLILCTVLVLGVVVPLLRHIPMAIPLEYLRAMSYGLLVALTLWQLWTVLLTLVPADKVKSSLDSSDARAATLRGMTVLGPKRKPPRTNESTDEAGP